MSDTDQKLREWVQVNRSFLDLLLDAFCIVNPQNRVVDFNVAFTELCGESYRKIQKAGDFCSLVTTEQCPTACPAKEVLTTGRNIRLDEVIGNSKAFPNLQLIIGGMPIHDTDGKILGVLLTLRNVSAENALQKKYDARKAESVTDGLTRLYNKVYAETMLLRLIKGSLRETPGLTVLLLDIDHFKKVNDTYGHQAGDYVLSGVAALAKEASRDSDVVGRFGGEEFIVVLANADKVGSKTFAERLRSKIEKKEFIFEKTKIPVTASIGMATFTEKWVLGSDPSIMMKALVAKADAALYFAKANGRNQVQQYEELPEDKKTVANVG